MKKLLKRLNRWPWLFSVQGAGCSVFITALALTSTNEWVRDFDMFMGGALAGMTLFAATETYVRLKYPPKLELEVPEEVKRRIQAEMEAVHEQAIAAVQARHPDMTYGDGVNRVRH